MASESKFARFRDTLEEKLVPIVDKISNNKYIKILTNSFIGIGALTIGASFFTLARALPLGDWYTNFLINTGLYDILNFPILITQELISLYLVIAIGYNVAKTFNKNTINGVMIALGSFLMLTPFETAVTFTTEAGEELVQTVSNVISISAFGSQGIFLAMISGMIATRIYVYFDDKGFKIKMPASVPENVTSMFEAMIPATMVFVIFMVIRVLCSMTPYGSAQNLVYGLLQAPLTNIGGGFGGAFVLMFLPLVFWLFGIHGNMLVGAVMAPIAQAMWTENMVAFANGTPCPHPEWMYSYFYSIGGSGATFALVLLMAFLAKSEHLKKLGRLAMPTSIFNINEPVIFGAPLVMNATLAVPFLAAPTVNFLLTALVNLVGFAVPTGAQINSYFPVGVVGAFATGNWQGFVWMVVLLILDMAIYYPFFKAYDKQKVAEEQAIAVKSSAAATDDDLLLDDDFGEDLDDELEGGLI